MKLFDKYLEAIRNEGIIYNSLSAKECERISYIVMMRFAEWIFENGWNFSLKTNRWIKHNVLPTPEHTTQQLLDLFLKEIKINFNNFETH